MPNNANNWYFDVNSTAINGGVFTLIDTESGNPPLPPIEGFFLISDGTNFLLSDGENLTLG